MLSIHLGPGISSQEICPAGRYFGLGHQAWARLDFYDGSLGTPTRSCAMPSDLVFINGGVEPTNTFAWKWPSTNPALSIAC